MIRFTVITAMASALVLLVACNQSQPPATQNANAQRAANTNAPANENAQGSDTARVAPNVSDQHDGPDGSQIAVKEFRNGQKIELRTWASGPVAKLTRRVGFDNKVTVRVKLREGTRYRIDDAGVIEHALDWSGAQLADAAKKLGHPIAAVGEDDDEKDDAPGGTSGPSNVNK